MTTQEQVLHLVKSAAGTDRDVEITPSSRLLDERILDSLGLVTLVGDLDETFHVTIRTEDFNIENFATVEDIARLVDKYQSG